MFASYLRRPMVSAQPLTAEQVAVAYNYPEATGKGYTVGIIELGGGYRETDIAQAAQRLGFDHLPNITAVSVGGAENSPGQDADAEVLLDIQVVLAVAPDASQRVYFAPNTDVGFQQAIEQAIEDGVNAISISWGGPESSWGSSAMASFDETFAKARAAGIVVTAAAGDSGSNDGTSKPATDFPASSPNVVACGGTRLLVNTDHSRASEVTWDDNDRTSATGGGVSAYFPGRNVPDVAGNADPNSGYEIVINGSVEVIGGTSAVAPLYAALVVVLSEAIGQPLGKQVDFMNTLLTNLGVCFDVTSGDNGAYRAGLGRDEVTGLGVVDGGKLLDVLKDAITDPAPFPTDPPPAPDPVDPTPPVDPPAPSLGANKELAKAMRKWLAAKNL